ncbi:MAG TPA: carboxypeptidase regulatory-like domain-containing protein [Candidatus Acidoferrum sp.]|nr:carboxypeptidase regulatory-like domain-containing protein [Candidatus Acidoferrum sp.]
MKKVFAVVCTLVLVSQPLLADENPGKPGKGKSSVAPVSEASSADAAKLPIRRVVLYKNGVGYFEHLGRVRGSQDVHIDFTSAQLNDVLKSLTVLDLSGGRITGVDYNSEAPLARRLATLRLALGERPTVMEFLGALRGARVEVRNGASLAIAGRILSVERKTRMGTAGSVEMEQISLITDAGEVRNIDLNTSTGVRIADHDLNAEIGKYLGLVASARDQDVRRMTISTTGAGDRNLYVSYISEVPIWKTTYRIVLPSKEGKKPLLQGWAIVDNTVGEDWNDVELSLVAGAPHSFIQQLSEPYYGRRPVVDLPESVQLSPQTHAATLLGGNGRLSGQVTDTSGAIVAGANVVLKNENGGVIAQTSTDSNGQYSFDGIATGNYQAEIQRAGFKKNELMALDVGPGDNIVNSQLQVGAVSETVEVTVEAVSVNSSAASMQSGNFGKLGVANRSRSSTGFGAGAGGGVAGGTGGGAFRAGVNGRNAEGLAMLAPGTVENSIAQLNAAANGAGLGDLFEYKLKDRVTLKKNQSALVPIAQTEIEAERVSLWSGTSGAGRPLRAIWVKNTSPLTFDGGSFSVLDNEVFAGEGLTDPLKPDERRILSYASDLGILVEAVQNSRPQHVTLAKISKGVLTQISEEEQRTLYTARSQEDSARTLVVEHPARPGWTLKKGAQEPEEKSPGTYRFRVSLAAKATATLPIEEVRPVSAVYQLANLGPDQVQLFQKNGSLTPEMATALQKITTQKAVVQKLEQEMEDRQKDIDRIVDDQGRLRENMKALRGSAEEKALLQRYTKQLDDQETLLAALRKKIQDTEAQRDSAQTQLETMIDELHLEASF